MGSTNGEFDLLKHLGVTVTIEETPVGSPRGSDAAVRSLESEFSGTSREGSNNVQRDVLPAGAFRGADGKEDIIKEGRVPSNHIAHYRAMINREGSIYPNMKPKIGPPPPKQKNIAGQSLEDHFDFGYVPIEEETTALRATRNCTISEGHIPVGGMTPMAGAEDLGVKDDIPFAGVDTFSHLESTSFVPASIEYEQKRINSKMKFAGKDTESAILHHPDGLIGGDSCAP